MTAACEEPCLPALAHYLRSDSLESEETPRKRRDIGLFPLSFQLLIFQLSVTSALQPKWVLAPSEDMGKGGFQCPYPSVSWYHSEPSWLLVSCKAVSWLLWSILMHYHPEHDTSQPRPFHPPLGTVALQAQRRSVKQRISPWAFFSTSCSFSGVVKESG